MGEIIEFRKQGECCATCRYWVPSPRKRSFMLDGPPYEYCKHPDKVKGYYLCDDIIQTLNLYRRPDSWCSGYRWKPRYTLEWPEVQLKLWSEREYHKQG